MKRDRAAVDRVLLIADELLENCPFDHTNPGSCPLHALRVRPRDDRLEWLKSLSVAEIEELVVYHWVCLEEKVLAAGPAPLTKVDARR